MMLRCWKFKTGYEEQFYDYCAQQMGISEPYSLDAAARMAYRIVLLAYSRVPIDLIKVARLGELLSYTRGRKVFWDAREAIQHMLEGRPPVDVRSRLLYLTDKYSKIVAPVHECAELDRAGWESLIS